MVILGSGSFGIVISNPRIPIIDETYSDIIGLDEVSKILYTESKSSENSHNSTFNSNNLEYYPADYEEFKFEYDDIIEFSNKYCFIFNNNYFMLPVKGGMINKEKFVKKFNTCEEYNFSWLNNSKNYFKIFKELFSSNLNLYQIVYKRGNKINLDIENFFVKILNVYECLKIANNAGIFFDDIKYENLIYHEEKIKIIDYSCPLDTNDNFENLIKNISKSKLFNIYYFPYDAISNVLLYEFADQIETIYFIKYDFEYYKLIFQNYIEFESNVNYKRKIIDYLYELCETIIPDYKVKLKLIDFEDIQNLDIGLTSENVQNYLKTIYIGWNELLESIDFLTGKNLINKKNELVVNKLIQTYKKYFNILYKEKKNRIISLLKKINLYSYGIIFIDWISKNKKKFIENKDMDYSGSFKRFLNIIGYCCSNFLIVENKIYFSNYDYNNINFNN